MAPDSPAWGAWLRTVPHDFYHRPGYLALTAELAGARAEAAAVDDGPRRWWIPYLVRPLDGVDGLAGQVGEDLTSPYGYPGPLANTVDAGFVQRASWAFAEAMAARGRVAGFFRLHPLLGVEDSTLPGSVVERGETVYVDLRRDEDRLWRETASGLRRDIRRSERAGIRASFEPPRPHLDAFMGMYDATMRLVGASPAYFFPGRYYEALVDVLEDELWMAVARDSHDEIIAASLFAHAGPVVQYHLSGSSEAGRRVDASKYLMHAARDWARRRGATSLHYGGGVGGAKDGLFAMKARFAATRATFRTWQPIFDATRYQALVDLRSANGGRSDPAFFPAYRA